jgi:hypothetical protein
VHKFATTTAFIAAISAGTAAGLSSPHSDGLVVGSLTQARGDMTLTQVLSPGSEWVYSFFEEDEDEYVPEMPDAEMPELCDRQELQDDYDDEEAQLPCGALPNRTAHTCPLSVNVMIVFWAMAMTRTALLPPPSDCRQHFEAFRASQESNSKPTVSFSEILTQLEEEDEDDSNPAVTPINTKTAVTPINTNPAVTPINSKPAATPVAPKSATAPVVIPNDL